MAATKKILCTGKTVNFAEAWPIPFCFVFCSSIRHLITSSPPLAACVKLRQRATFPEKKKNFGFVCLLAAFIIFEEDLMVLCCLPAFLRRSRKREIN